MAGFIERFAKDEAGVTAMEYGMIAALIAVVIIGVMADLGDELKVTFETIEGEIETANTK